MDTAKAPIEAFYRYDYVKFTFRDSHPEHSRKRFDLATRHVNEYMGDALPGTWREPKQTFLAPNSTRPNGLHIIEVWGQAAGAVVRFPWSWVEYLTFAHVKTYGDGKDTQSYDELLHLFDTPGYRKSTRITPRRQKHSVKDSRRPGLSIGSKKSDLHFAIYVRPGEKIGVEGRFRDERLAVARDNAVLATGEPTTRQPRGYLMLLRFLATVAQSQLDYEFLSRDAEVDEYLHNFGTARLSAWASTFHGSPAWTPSDEPMFEDDQPEAEE